MAGVNEGVTRTRRIALLTTAFLLAACATQAAVSPSTSPFASAPSPSPAPTASARPLNSTNDILYVRTAGPYQMMIIRAIDARTGETLRELPSGMLTRDGKTLYSIDGTGGTTLVRIMDLASGEEVRSLKVSATSGSPTT